MTDKDGGADFYSYRPLPKSSLDAQSLCRDMVALQRKNGATFHRMTCFDDEEPSEIYPHGFYLEGWKLAPKVQGNFDFPLQSLEAKP